MYLFWLASLNWLLALGGLTLAVLTVFLYVDFFLLKGEYTKSWIRPLLWPSIIGVSVGSIVISLLYSEYFGFIPCSLCWLQRIAVYPQAVMSLIAFRTQDEKSFPLYGIALSIFGFVVAIYQYIYQMLPREALTSGFVPCLADGSNADCAVKVIDEFGFVTFPFITAVSFAFLVIVYIHLRRSR